MLGSKRFEFQIKDDKKIECRTIVCARLILTFLPQNFVVVTQEPPPYQSFQIFSVEYLNFTTRREVAI